MSAPQPRDALGQFASRECASTYRVLAALRPPEPEQGDRWTDPENPQRTHLRVERCPHGHFLRWAARHCKGPGCR